MLEQPLRDDAAHAAIAFGLLTVVWDQWALRVDGFETSRRARNAENTRALLLAVARDAFTTQGFANTTIDDILTGADVAKGAQYHHFAGKEDLLRTVATEVQSELDERIAGAQKRTLDSWSRVDLGCTALLDPCRIPLEPLAHMLCGAIQEGALLIAASPHPRQERRAVGETTGFLPHLDPHATPGLLSREDAYPVDAGPLPPNNDA